MMNQLFKKRLKDADNALAELTRRNVEVLSINLDSAIPLLRVRPTKGLHKECGAWRRSRNNNGQRIDVMRGSLGKCFVEWEVQP